MWNIRPKERSRSNSEARTQLDNCSGSGLIPETGFIRLLLLEQKRTERSRRRFALMLVDCSNLLTVSKTEEVLEKLLGALSRSTRETDAKGWYKKGVVVGIIFTEIALADRRSVVNTLLTKIWAALGGTLTTEQTNRIALSCHVFPEDWHEGGPGGSANSIHVDQAQDGYAKRPALLVKKSVDILGSLLALTIFSPLLVAIAIAIKLTSKGPILFRQQRVGQSGRPFTFLKFRSMCSTDGHAIHQEYVKRFISGDIGPEQASGKSVYKLTRDPRITPVGRLLRRTSFDELPQLFNVLLGQMSLVGPRPPIPYEVECYDIWHKRRLLMVKPGITGLWQVRGRSRIKFDEMVRLDLEYARAWSLWLDIKILLQTPRAMFSGDGAY
jgi:lipopolysaccharide/colanic/teichoic acid biosynthesis glycosyltransferase